MKGIIRIIPGTGIKCLYYDTIRETSHLLLTLLGMIRYGTYMIPVYVEVRT